MRIGIYPGTFDPITNGHLNIIERSLAVVDRLIVAIAKDTSKIPLFSLEERIDMIMHEVQSFKGSAHRSVIVEGFSGLLVNFAQKNNATIIIRGLRAVSDFEYEFQLAGANAQLSKTIETIFLPATSYNHYVSSSLVKEIARLQGDVSSFVSPYIAKKLGANKAENIQ